MGNFPFLCCELNYIMTEYCPRTGSPECKCENKLAPTPIGNALLTDAKCGVRKLFSDHEKYTNWLIISSFGKLPDARDVVNRMNHNADEIAKFVSPLIDTDNKKEHSSVIKQLLLDHIQHAGNLINSLLGNTGLYEAESRSLILQGDKLALALSKFIPSLDQQKVTQEFRTHNMFVINLTVSRHNNVSGKDYIALYDKYSDHMAKFADMLYYALVKRD